MKEGRKVVVVLEESIQVCGTVCIEHMAVETCMAFQCSTQKKELR